MRRIAFCFALLGAVAAHSTAQAEWWWNTFWHNVGRDYHRNNAWPEPFTLQDRQTVSGPFNMMVAKGWEKQNLLMDHHFDEKTQGLTTAGQMKVRAILTQSPPNRRVIYVQRAMTPAQTLARVDVAQQAAVGMLAEGDLPAVAVSDMDSTGWPAEYVDAVGRKFQASHPDPRIPRSTTGGGDSGAAGSSSGRTK